MSWELQLAARARRDLDRLSQRDREAVDQKLDQAAEDPFATNIIKLHGPVDRWRIRAGDYRIVVQLEFRERLITVLRVQHRRDVYRQS